MKRDIEVLNKKSKSDKMQIEVLKMINIENAKKEFIEYTEQFDLKNENIERKQLHSLRVMEISKEIATRLELNKEEIELATLIGLLHDIARFEQYTQFKTYKDADSFDHGDYAVGILEKDIRKYIKDNKYDNVIMKAVKNHNKYEIENGLNEQELLCAKIIRDADKIDIFYEAIEVFWIGEEEQIEKAKISEKILNQFYNNTTIKREKGLNIIGIDKIITIIAFIFDMNFNKSFEIIKENDYINRILNRFDFKDEQTKEEIEKIKKIANNYIAEKTK